MIAPRIPIHHRGVTYDITQLQEAWVIDVAGGKYFLTAGDTYMTQARRFLSGLPKNPIYPRTPAFVATPGHPLLLEIDGVLVRAWPARVPRDHPTWSPTYLDSRTGERVLATEDKPRWMFAARGRTRSPDGEASGEHSVDDVVEMARRWIHTTEVGGNEG